MPSVVPTEMDADAGTMVQTMVLDTLSGRSPLYRLADFFKHQDTELLLGRHLADSVFNDTSVGRAMDAIFEVGAEKLFGDVACQVCRRFPLDMSKAHFDTASVNVWGNYDQCNSDSDKINITQLHYIETSVCKKVRYARGRPKKGQSCNIASEYYFLDAKVRPNLEHIEQQPKEAGCFVLLCNVRLEGDGAQTGADLLRAYKEQYTIGRNFSFLKDPLIVKDMFLKKPERIEVLGAILRMALLI